MMTWMAMLCSSNDTSDCNTTSCLFRLEFRSNTRKMTWTEILWWRYHFKQTSWWNNGRSISHLLFNHITRILRDIKRYHCSLHVSLASLVAQSSWHLPQKSSISFLLPMNQIAEIIDPLAKPHEITVSTVVSVSGSDFVLWNQWIECPGFGILMSQSESSQGEMSREGWKGY